MNSVDKQIETLREALRLSPDNIPLRSHLAETLVTAGRLNEAEDEYRLALAQSPQNQVLKVALAELYYQQGKRSQASVIVEDLVQKKQATAAAYVLYARLLEFQGETDNAKAQYKLALELDPDESDEELATRLGLESDNPQRSEQRLPAGFEDFDEDDLPEADDEEEDWPLETKLERPQVSFADVGGMQELKDEISLKIIYPLQHPELYKAYGKKVGGGILMYGPPGCGKTYIARATAGEINASFLAVGINDVLDMWLGNSERNLHDIFEQARQNTPCVLFFDEVDALGGKRSDMRQGGARNIINQFLAELDGVEFSNEGILVLAATNAPWHVDAAFRRPGRFDRVMLVPPPDETARGEILRILLREKPTDHIDYAFLAKQTDQLSGADLTALVDKTVEMKLHDALKTGRPLPITTRDLSQVARKLQPSTKEWFATARNHALYSNQGGLYDDVLKYLNIK